MTIRAINGRGVNRAEAVCDACGRVEVVTCDYERRPAGDWLPNEGQVHRKCMGRRWELVKGALWCPACAGRRRAAAAAQKGDDDMAKGGGAKVVAMPAAAPPREPTLDEKAAINEALMVSYDRKARRYLGADTDSTIAAQLGGGILPGWVAAIREQFCGPAGGNEEMEALRLDVRKALAEAEGRVDAVAQLRGEVEALARAAEAKCAGLRDLEKRLDAVIKAVGPRAGAR